MSDSFYFGVAIKGPCGGLFLSGRYGACEYPSLEEQTERLLCPFLEQYDSTVFSHARPYSAVAEGTIANIPFILLFNPPDTDSFVCPEVENFTYLGIQGFYPTFMWTSGDGVQQYEVCYGPYDADVNTLPTVTVDSTNVCVLTDRTLSPDIYYQARCRAVCHHVCPIHDTVLHTPWSAPQYFYMGSSMPDTTHHDTTHHDTSHVALPPSLSPLPFTLSPNPAHGNVTLLLPEDALPANVVMRDAAGREVLRMGEHCGVMLESLRAVLGETEPDPALEQSVFDAESDLDTAQTEISHYLGRILESGGAKLGDVAVAIRRQLRCADEFESVSDYVQNALKAMLKIRDAGEKLSAVAIDEVRNLIDAVQSFRTLTLEILEKDRPTFQELATAHAATRRINALAKEYRQRHFDRLEHDCTGPVKGVIYNDLLASFRRMNEHLINAVETREGK